MAFKFIVPAIQFVSLRRARFGAAWIFTVVAVSAGCSAKLESPAARPLDGQGPSEGAATLPATEAPGTTDEPTLDAAQRSVREGAPSVQRETAGPSAWCDALAVFQDNCQGCHGDELRFGAPMPLVRFEDLVAPSGVGGTESVYERVAARIHDPRSPMPPGGMPAADVAVLDAWLNEGATAGADPTCGDSTLVGSAPIPAIEGEFPWPDDCEEFFSITVGNGGASHVVPAGSEQHPQFIFDAPWGSDEVQILAHRPIVDNDRVLHHWILYENQAGGLFGGGFGGKFIVGWAPGSQGSRGNLPPDVGMYAPGGSGSLRLDMHYYNLGNTEAESDDSGVEVCISRTPRANTATVIGLLGDATAPVGRSENVASCTASVTAGQGVRLLSVSPHMHQLGVHAKLELTRNGQTTVLHDAPFDFEDQRIYDLDDVEVLSGDVLTTTCSYDNATGRTVRFGQDSDDEMCFNFVTYYPMGALGCGFAL